MDSELRTSVAADTAGIAFNPLTAEFKRDPYASYALLREHDPVHRSPLGVWVILRYDDVASVLKNPAVFSSQGMGGGTIISGKPVRTIINTDPPQHTQIRNLVNRAFTPRMVADMEPRIREITRGLLDAVVPSGKMDIVEDLAVPLPVTIIAEILGVDPARRADFKRWSNAVIAQTANGATGAYDNGAKDRADFLEYFQQAIEERRRRPGTDLISVVVQAEDGGAALSADEVAAFTMLLLVAGNETTTNLIGNAMAALTDAPEQLEAVANDASMIPGMIEEALRFDSPVQFLFRTTTRETEVGGNVIPAGVTVVPVYASANRDDARFPEAARFDIRRNAQGHLAFGLGPHFCLGAPLARLEAKVAFEELFARTRNIRRVEPEVPRIDSLFLRGPSRLAIEFDAA